MSPLSRAVFPFIIGSKGGRHPMFDFQQISRYRENNRLEAKLATGGLPRSIWETYSAFANTYGGVILLGVEELPDHTLRVQGLLEPRELVDEFTALLQDPAGGQRQPAHPWRHPGSPRRRRGYRGHHGAPGGAGSAPGLHRRRPGPRLLPPQRRRGLPLYPGGAQRHAGRPLPLTAGPRPPSGRGPVRFAPARPAGYGSTPPAAPGRAGAPRPAGREMPCRGPTGYRNRPPPMDRAWSSPVLPPSG